MTNLSKQKRAMRPLSDRLATARKRGEAVKGRHCVSCGALCREAGGCTRCGGESHDVAAFKADVTRRLT